MAATCLISLLLQRESCRRLASSIIVATISVRCHMPSTSAQHSAAPACRTRIAVQHVARMFFAFQPAHTRPLRRSQQSPSHSSPPQPARDNALLRCSQRRAQYGVECAQRKARGVATPLL